MLEGLEAVEIPLSTCREIIDFRIDANTYKKEYLASEQLLKKMKTHSVGEISNSIQNFGAYSLCNFINFQNEGIPFLMTKNIRENFIDWNLEKYVDQKSHDMLWKSHCHRGQVLVTMAGEYLGRVAVYNSDSEASSNQAIAKVSLKKGQSSYTVSTFLNSKFGQHQIQRFKTITGQPNINMSLIESLRVPEFSKEISEGIEALMCRIDDVKGEAFSTYAQAETLLLDTLGMADFSPNTETVNIKSFKDSFASTGRLDAEYYQPKYEAYQSHVFISSAGWDTLANICNLKDSNYTPKETSEYDYIELSDIDKSGGVTGCTRAIGQELPSRARRKVQAGDVLISSIEGSLTSCAIVPESLGGALCSTGFYVVASDKINSETLLVLFKSVLMQNLLKQSCSGTILTAINKSEISNLPVPMIEAKAQKKIATLVKESFALRAESERLLAVAKRAVEIAIEQDEAAAMSYLEEQA